MGRVLLLLLQLVVSEKMHHLGNDSVKWAGTTAKPEGTKLELPFDSDAGEKTLVLRQFHVDDVWTVTINGEAVGTLRQKSEPATTYFSVRAGLLAAKNTLTVTTPRVDDDILVGDIRLFDAPLREHRKLSRVTVSVKDGIPARITVTDAAGALQDIYGAAEGTPVRDGLLYTSGGSFDVPAGSLKISATRGMEWSLQEVALDVAPATPGRAEFDLRREVDTTGWIAADTHIHTYTHSGHGDATVEERIVTLAGEGVELAVATDHNHNTDYKPHQGKFSKHFTSVVGNEVTTPIGHFNAFPLNPKDPIPEHDVRNWTKVVEGIRARGAKVVILNHPHWPNLREGPFGELGFVPHAGDRAAYGAFTFDAIELVNSTCDEKQPLSLIEDWLALMNRGERFTGIGSSDSHTVGDPVGQGRSYVPSATDDPAAIDVDAACVAFRKGRTTVSLGIFAAVSKMGETVAVRGSYDVELRVASAGWIRPRRALFLINGKTVAEREVPCETGKATDVKIAAKLEAPAYDGHLVCVVLGDGVPLPAWKTLNDYTIAVTNPVFLDVDGGGYASPRETARRLLDGGAGVESMPEPIGLQALSLLREREVDLSTLELKNSAYVDYRERVSRQAAKRHDHR